MRLTGDIVDAVAGTWIAYTPATTVTFAAVEGTKTVNVEYRDAVNNTTGVAMPAKGANVTLTDAEIQLIVEYIRSLSD